MFFKYMRNISLPLSIIGYPTTSIITTMKSKPNVQMVWKDNNDCSEAVEKKKGIFKVRTMCLMLKLTHASKTVATSIFSFFKLCFAHVLAVNNARLKKMLTYSPSWLSYARLYLTYIPYIYHRFGWLVYVNLLIT